MPQIVAHGTLDYAELASLGLSPDEVYVFSSNINPYGPPPAVVQAVQAAVKPTTISRYPDRLAMELRRAVARLHQVPEEAVLAGNGTADIMWLIALLFAPDARVAIVSPTFGEYENVASLVDAQVIQPCHPGWERREDGRYTPGATTLDELGEALAEQTPRLIFLCNPNNPTGHHLSPDELERLHSFAPESIWVVDEAYAEFTPTPWSASRWIDQGDWIILRSMTKDFSLAGLRVGYAVGSPHLIQAMQVAQPPWNVNTLAQIAGTTALDNLAWRAETTARLRQETEALRQALQAAGMAPLPTSTNFFLLPVEDATQVRQALVQQRILVRDCTSFGLPNYIRIATQRPEENRLLVEALQALQGDAS